MGRRTQVRSDHVTNRAEMLALCMVLELHPDASYERPTERHGVRTPDWFLQIDSRSIAMEVTSKKTDWRYEDWPTGNTTKRVGHRHKSWTTGDTADLCKTLERKMKDKAVRGQLQAASVDERWLCIQLDADAGTELQSLFTPVPSITIDVAPDQITSVCLVATMPSFNDIMERARHFGYDEVWAFTQAVEAKGRTMVLRLILSKERWECFHMLGEWRFKDGGIACVG